jgi:hypothetical protein
MSVPPSSPAQRLRESQAGKTIAEWLISLRSMATEASYHLRALAQALGPNAINVVGSVHVVMLGTTYIPRPLGRAAMDERVARVVSDIRSRFWFTYRSGFAPIEVSAVPAALYLPASCHAMRAHSLALRFSDSLHHPLVHLARRVLLVGRAPPSRATPGGAACSAVGK